MRIYSKSVLGMFIFMLFSHYTSAAEMIKIGTLFPKTSPWGQVMENWRKTVTAKSGGKLEIQIFYNGSLGDEGAMIGSIKSGYLDGAAVSSIGLGKIYKPILALEMPGLFTSWAKLDKARDTMRKEFEKGILDAGFTLGDFFDIGAVRIMSNGFAIASPDDLKGKKPFLWKDNDLTSILYKALGGIAPIPLTIPEVLPNLNTGAINCLFSSCLFAEQLKWSTKLNNICSDIESIQVGGIVFSSKKINALPLELKNILIETAKVASNSMTKKIRVDDDASFKRLKVRMTVTTKNVDQKSKWDAINKKTRANLSNGTFSPVLVAKLEKLAQ